MDKNKIIKLTNVVNSLSLSKQQRDVFIDFNNEYNIIVSEENRIINDTNLYEYCLKNGTHNVIININNVKLNAYVNITVPNIIKYCIPSGTQETMLIPLVVINNK